MRRAPTTVGRAWREPGFARELSRRAVKRARIKSLVLGPALVAILAGYHHRDLLVGREWDPAARVVTATLLVAIGWEFARDAGRALGPTLLRRLEPGTAGAVGFLIRLCTLAVAVTFALRVAGLAPRELFLGGAITAVVGGLAAQQTLGNLIAGTVLLSARPFRVGDRVRLQGGALAGSVEGVVSTLGLLYTTLASGEDAIMVPNAAVLSVAVQPLREPTAVDLRARLRHGVTPTSLQRDLEQAIDTPVRGHPRITLEEVDDDRVVVRVTATPARPADGSQLASELVRGIAPYTSSGED